MRAKGKGDFIFARDDIPALTAVLVDGLSVTNMAIDVAFLTLNLALFAGIGLPACLLLRSEVSTLAAPAFGLGIFGVAATLLYKLGLPLHLVGFAGWLASLLGLTLLFFRPITEYRRAALTAAIAASVSIIIVIPKWIGGPQFTAFQGNEWDHFNYIAEASSYATKSYVDLLNLDDQSINNFWSFAANNLWKRPTVAIVLAAIRWPYYKTTADSAYTFLCLLQLTGFFALSYLLVGIMRVPIMRGLLIAGAVAIGFHFQYVLDINAWSELAAIPLGLLLVCCVALAVRPSIKPPLFSLTSVAAAVAIALTSVLYFYPEMITVYGPACAAAALVGWRLNQTGKWLRQLWTLAAAACASVLICLLYLRGTLQFLIGQLSFAKKAITWDWIIVSDRPFIGGDVEYATVFSNGALGEKIYAIMSLPVDVGLGVLGVYFLVPSAGLPIALRAGWKMAAASVMTAMLYLALRCLWQLWQERDDRVPVIVAAIGVLFTPLSSLIISFFSAPSAGYVWSYVWSAGKGFSMGAPLFIIFVILPFIVEGQVKWSTIPSILLLVLHTGFGLQRAMAAADFDGRIRPPPYITGDALPKIKIDWDFAAIAGQLRQCHHLALDLEDPHLDRYAQVYVTDLGIRWTSRRPLNEYYGHGRNLGQRPDPVDADCLLTDNKRRWGSRRIFWRGLSRTDLQPR